MRVSNEQKKIVRSMSMSRAHFLLIAAILCTVIALSGCDVIRPGTSSAADPSTIATTTLSVPTPTPIPLEPYAFDIADFSVAETLDGNQYTIQRIQLGSDGELIITTDASTNTGMYGSLSTLSLMRDNVKERSFDTSFGSPGYYKNAYVTVNNELKEIKLTAISREKLYDREIILYDYIDDAGNLVSKITLPNNIILFNKTEEMSEDNNYADSALYSDACIFVGSEIRAFTDAKVVEIKDETGSVKSFLIKAKTSDGQFQEFMVDKKDAFFHKTIDGTEDYNSMVQCSGFEESCMYIDAKYDGMNILFMADVTNLYMGDDLVKLVSNNGKEIYYGSVFKASFTTINEETSLSKAVPDGISNLKFCSIKLMDYSTKTCSVGNGKIFELNDILYAYMKEKNGEKIIPLDSKGVNDLVDGNFFENDMPVTTENGWNVVEDAQAGIFESNIYYFSDISNRIIYGSDLDTSDYTKQIIGYKSEIDEFGNNFFVLGIETIMKGQEPFKGVERMSSDSVLINNTELSYFQNSETFDCIYDSDAESQMVA